MEQVFNLKEVNQLYSEIQGLVDKETKEVVFKGLLSQKLSLTTKHKLNKLEALTKQELESVEKNQKSLLEELGEKRQDGSFFIPEFIEEKDAEGNTIMEEISFEGKKIEIPKKVVNPNYALFEKEFSDYLEKEMTLDIPEFTLEDLKTKEYPNGLEADENYQIFDSKVLKIKE